VTNAKSQYVGKFWQGSRKRYNYACLRIPRSRVQKALLAEANVQGLPIVYGKKLVGLREDNDSVQLEFADGTTATSAFVVGADGVHSNVRDCIMDTEMGYSGFMGIIGMGLQREKLHESARNVFLPNFVFGKTGFVAIMPSNYEGTEVDFFSTMPYPTHTRQEWEALSNDKTELQKILQQRFGKDWPQFICNITKEYNKEGLGLYPWVSIPALPTGLLIDDRFFEVPPLDRWTSVGGRVVLIGDAAHAFTPQAGQGAAVGLEDAETLAHTISREGFLTDYWPILKVWESHRKVRLQQVKRLTDINGRLRSPDPPLMQSIKEWIMWSTFKWHGSLGGLEWLFDYNAENILSHF
jgi:2-polyprenyl-6-methoxyphenol hydroxylase-like FAD-dependent oxidoreductase